MNHPALAVFGLALLTACASTQAPRAESGVARGGKDPSRTETGSTNAQEVLVFENSSEVAVGVYLRTATREIRIGRADPGRTVRMRLETDVINTTGEVQLHVVPAGERAAASAPPSARPAPILSFPTEVGYLTRVKWVLLGRELRASPL